MAFTRAAWNALIKSVNALISGNSLTADPLAEVKKNHVWSKADVTVVQNKLKEICTNGPTFDSFAKWSQKLIDELEKAISECECTTTIQWYFVSVSHYLYGTLRQVSTQGCYPSQAKAQIEADKLNASGVSWSYNTAVVYGPYSTLSQAQSAAAALEVSYS
jgi:hypothetical protein